MEQPNRNPEEPSEQLETVRTAVWTALNTRHGEHLPMPDQEEPSLQHPEVVTGSHSGEFDNLSAVRDCNGAIVGYVNRRALHEGAGWAPEEVGGHVVRNTGSSIGRRRAGRPIASSSRRESVSATSDSLGHDPSFMSRRAAFLHKKVIGLSATALLASGLLIWGGVEHATSRGTTVSRPNTASQGEPAQPSGLPAGASYDPAAHKQSGESHGGTGRQYCTPRPMNLEFDCGSWSFDIVGVGNVHVFPPGWNNFVGITTGHYVSVGKWKIKTGEEVVHPDSSTPTIGRLWMRLKQ